MQKGQFVGLIIALSLIVAGVLGFWIYWEVTQSDVEMDLSHEKLTVGQILKCKVLNANEDDTYLWDFGDGTNETGASVEHYYTSIGEYNVTLYLVEDSQKEEKGVQFVKVTDLVFRLPEPRFGDLATYDLVGFLNASDSDGIMTFQQSEENISLIGLEFLLEGPLRMNWNNETAYDGYGHLHDVLAREFVLDSVLDGLLIGKTSVGTIQFDMNDMDMKVAFTDNLDLDTNGTVVTDTDLEFNSSGNAPMGIDAFEMSSHLFQDFRIPSLISLTQAGLYGNNISMSTTEYVVPNILTWEMVGPENMGGEPVYHFRGSIPSDTEVTFDIWLGKANNKIPRFRISVNDESNAEMSILLEGRLISDGRGDEVIPYGSCRQDVWYHLLPSRPDLEIMSQTGLRRLPHVGTNETWFGNYTPETAISQAMANQTVSHYFNSHADAFVSMASFGHPSNNTSFWHFDFLTSENASMLQFEVYKTLDEFTVVNATVVAVESPTGKLPATEILTFSQAEALLANDPFLTAHGYNDGPVSNWTLTYVLELNVMQDGIGSGGLTTLLGGIPEGKGYVFSKNDGSVQVAFDADDGFLYFVNESKGETDFF